MSFVLGGKLGGSNLHFFGVDTRKMELIEMASKSKTGFSGDSEEVIFLSSYFIAILTGYSGGSSLSFTYEGEKVSGGRFISLLGGRILEEVRPWLPFKDLLGEISDKLETALQAIYPNISNEQRPRLEIALYSHLRKSILVVGNFSVRINNLNYFYKKNLDRVLGDFRSLYNQTLLEQGLIDLEGLKKKDPGYEAILPVLNQYSSFLHSSNLDFGFEAIDGRAFGNYADVGIYPVDSGDTVALTSAGYPKVFLTLKETETCLEFYQQMDPQRLAENRGLWGTGENDLSYADRSYISFVV